ncbi:MAG TPA: nucleoside triphosphate pyrophosphohydrolase [Candidatus Krumholzibacteria bacterium]|nr:nucleoside triphosphate pyrophosphohydrolase [Candidatus Krumholzibacteria bacterium]HPD71083.1 nucleoside triphosphate pyrophosphohydrolase [Candidatus Krumholzibacteria bacterium]HRY39217.1 nucleoside triphosphate pyrophosphohydrolase [Candidatus Krumholzibacteria bacterium]
MLANVHALVRTIDILRSPGGCPWDRKQTLESAAHHLQDEAAEVLESAIAGDPAHVREELGDLLFMVCFVTRVLGETLPTDLDDVARRGNEKLVRRHPHVFGDSAARDVEESQARWDAIKAEEKRGLGLDPDGESILKDLPASLPPLHQAYRYQKDAAAVGFDWPDADGVWAKLREEESELRAAVAAGDADAIEHEVGDALFAWANLARKLGVQPDVALRKANRRFRTRFHRVETVFGNDPAAMRAAGLDAMEAAWQAAKRSERDAG